MNSQRSMSMARRNSTSPMGAAPYINHLKLDKSACITPGTSNKDCTTVGTKKVCVTRCCAISSTILEVLTSRIRMVWPPTVMALVP